MSDAIAPLSGRPRRQWPFGRLDVAKIQLTGDPATPAVCWGLTTTRHAKVSGCAAAMPISPSSGPGLPSAKSKFWRPRVFS
jgi:hypothetical protein